MTKITKTQLIDAYAETYCILTIIISILVAIFVMVGAFAIFTV